MSIGNFTEDERLIIANMQDEFRVAVYVVAPAFRVGVTCGVQRALAAARKAAPGQQIKAIEALLD